MSHPMSPYVSSLKRMSLVWIMGLFIIGLSRPAMAEVIEIKVGTLAPKTSLWGQLLKELRKEVYLQTRDKEQTIRLEIYYGGVQGDEFEIAKKIRYGQLEGGFFSGNGLGSLCKAVRILDLPFLFESYDEADYVYDKLRPELNNIFDKEGFELVAVAPLGYVYFFSKRDIDSFEALQQTKMWIWKGDRLVYTAMKIMEIPAVPINFNQVTSALQTGLINTVYATPTVLIALQWYKDLDVINDMKVNVVAGGLTLSKAAWKKLSIQGQEYLRSITQERLNQMVKENRKSDELALEELQNQGFKVVSMGADAPQIKEYGDQLQKELEGKLFPTSLLKQTKRHLEEYRKAPAK